MVTGRALVIGASGFTGSHVTRQLEARGDRVRALVRPTSSTRALEGLDVEIVRGDIFDADSIRSAMAGCDTVYYCVVDARMWLRDSTPLWRTNVEGLRTVLDVAVEADLHRFVFLSTIGTMAISHDRLVTEDAPFNWPGLGGAYIASRVAAENLVLEYARERALPAVALCVSVTFGPDDWAPTRHGAALHDVACGRLPFHIRGTGWEVVGIEDAARAMLLAAERGRVGERYIISDRFVTTLELFTLAARAGEVRAPRIGIPLGAMYAVGRIVDLAARLLRRDLLMTTLAVRMMHVMTPLDHSKAERELGWHPEPIEDVVRRAMQFYVASGVVHPRPDGRRLTRICSSV